MLPDLVFRAGPSTDGHDELRYAIRSQTTNLPHANVVVAGVIPDWWTGNVIPVPVSGGKYDHAYAVLRAILAADDLTPEVVISDDDMFLLEPLDAMPAYHCGPLADRVLRSRTQAKTDTLAAAGPDVLSREVHTPTLVERTDLAERLDALQLPADRVHRILWRTLTPGADTPHHDHVKVHHGDQTEIDGPWVSTNVHSWAGWTGQHIRATFTQPHPWEC